MQLLAWWFSVYGFWHPLARRIEGATRDLDLTKRLWASPMNTTTSHAREHCNWIFGSTLLYTLQKRDREEKIIVDFCYILQEKLKWPQKLYFLLTPQMTRERVGSREKCSDGQLWRSTLRARLFRSGCKISSNEKRRHQMRPSLRSALLFSGNRLKKTHEKHSQQSDFEILSALTPKEEWILWFASYGSCETNFFSSMSPHIHSCSVGFFWLTLSRTRVLVGVLGHGEHLHLLSARVSMTPDICNAS